MKSGWVTKKLGEVCEIIHGRNQSSVADENGKYPIYGSGGVMGWATDFRCPAGCTIVGRKGSINNPIFVSEKFWNVDTAYALSPIDIEAKWLFYFCRSFDFAQLDCGTTIPSLTSALVKEIPIPIPPLSEQKRIVKKIDAAFEKIDKLKANAEKNLANAKELFQSALDEAMRPKKGWVEKRLPDISENCDSKRIPITKSKRESGKIPYYGASGIVDYVKDFIFDGKYLLISEDGANLESRTYPIAFSISGKTWVNNHAHILRFFDENVQEYAELYLNAISLKNYITGAAQPKLTQDNLNKIPIYIPAQNVMVAEIVNKLKFLKSKLETLQHNYAQQIADCAEMRQAVLREAFEGRL